jgi:hypothetical protein
MMLGSDSEEENDKVMMELQDGPQFKHVFPQKQEMFENREGTSTVQSLPIDPYLTKRSGKDLNKIVGQEKSVQSQINPNSIVINGLRLNDMSSRRNTGRSSRQKVSLKYYCSLDTEVEMDPEIAGDLAFFAAS